jgi:hypothetical protein
VCQLREDGEFGGNLGAAHDRDQRPLGVVQGLAQGLQLGRQQRPGAGYRSVLGDAVRAGLGPVRGRKRVVDVDVTQRGHLPGERLVIFLLAAVATAVLEQHGPARVHAHPVQPVVQERDVRAEQLGQALCHRRERFLRVELPFGGAAQVRHQQQPCALRQRMLDPRQGSADARVVADHAVLQRHVEVLADEHALAREVEVGHFQDGHDLSSSACTTNSAEVDPARAGNIRLTRRWHGASMRESEHRDTMRWGPCALDRFLRAEGSVTSRSSGPPWYPAFGC